MTLRRRTSIGILAAIMSSTGLFGQSTSPAPTTAPADKPPIPQEELEALVAPIALYPDDVVSQILMAATYPLEVVQADRFVKADTALKDKALTDALEKQDWDPSVKSLVNFPQVLDMMSVKLDATIKLGDTFIDDQKRVLDAIQKLRVKAQTAGNLKSNPQQNVVVVQAPETQTQVIQIQPTNPQVIYVPTYNPTVVYGTWPYPAYPPAPYYPPGYVATAAISFGVGVACGAAWGYAWGNCNWGRGDVNINNSKNVNINNNIDRSKYQNKVENRPAGGNNGTFQHDPSHRQGVAYRDNAAAQKFGGASSNQAAQARDAYRGRADTGRQNLSSGSGQLGGAGGGARPSTGGPGGAAGGARPSTGGPGGAAGGARPSTGGPTGAAGGARPSTGGPGGAAGGARPSTGSPSAAARPSTSNVQNRGTSSSAFSGASGSRGSAQSASQRGSASRSASPARSSGGGGGGRRR